VLHRRDGRHFNEVNMKRLTLTIGIGLIVCGIPSAQGQAPTATTGTRPAPTASANLVDAQGRSVGQAYLQQAPHGILLKLDLKNTTPGIHGLHIHDVGRCERPSFESAGGHFNPSNRQHGLLNPRGPHAGDLPNIEVPTTTQLSVEYFLADVTIEPGPRSLSDNNGSSIVIHAGKDDYATDPAGESGDRLACGPIVRSEAR
jgi:Cu-Zn family superoxide dismutase